MTELKQVYKCGVCGNMVELVHNGAGELVCCGQAMELKIEQSEEEKFEKHRPTVKWTGDGVTVKVGIVPHPMESEHYIEWIEVVTEHQVFRKYLDPGMVPEAEFCLRAERVEVRAYCNVHGLWKSSLKLHK